MTRINKLLTVKCKGNLCTKVKHTYEQYNAQIKTVIFAEEGLARLREDL
jgi:hypothetical protein